MNNSFATKDSVIKLASIYNECIQIFWLTAAFSFCILLIVARTIYEIGNLKPKNSRHLASKNLLQIAIVIICYFTTGFALQKGAYGGFFGTKEYFLKD